jgi:hypothetical protein
MHSEDKTKTLDETNTKCNKMRKYENVPNKEQEYIIEKIRFRSMPKAYFIHS